MAATDRGRLLITKSLCLLDCLCASSVVSGLGIQGTHSCSLFVPSYSTLSDPILDVSFPSHDGFLMDLHISLTWWSCQNSWWTILTTWCLAVSSLGDPSLSNPNSTSGDTLRKIKGIIMQWKLHDFTSESQESTSFFFFFPPYDTVINST